MNPSKKYNPDLKKNLIVNMTFSFSLDVMRYSESLEQERSYIVARQVLRSGTSIGANVREAQNAESKLDFIHKMKIAAKEADEAEYWLELCSQSPNYPNCTELLAKIVVIKKVLSKIIATSKKSS